MRKPPAQLRQWNHSRAQVSYQLNVILKCITVHVTIAIFVSHKELEGNALGEFNKSEVKIKLVSELCRDILSIF